MSKKEFSIPPLAVIKAANQISSKNEPSLFKATSVQLKTTASSDPIAALRPKSSATGATCGDQVPGPSVHGTETERKGIQADESAPGTCGS